MKKAFKIIIPIILVFSVLLSIGWYLFQYDPDFTRDFLLNRARAAEERGHHSVAAWIYDLTYRQSNENEDVAIELVEHFKSIGNYTKAEYTLSNAIADGGTANLHIALCQTYVEQNKLLDAVTMLDNIADPEIKSQLDAIRPPAPTATHESGYYNQYITVSIEAEQGTLCVNTNGEYPSDKSNDRSTEITLEAGETLIYALNVGDNGLVSPLSIFNYTVAGVIEEVSLNDPQIDQIVRQQLNLTEDQAIYSNQLWGITSLEITPEVNDLSDLTFMPFLEQLTIPCGNYENFDVISTLGSLQKLSINKVTLTSSNMQNIGKLPKLHTLSLTDCNLLSIESLSTLTTLTSLDISYNAISNLSPLTNITELKVLNISNNKITHLNDIASMKQLVELDVSNNSLTSLNELITCTSIKNLRADNNALSTLEGLEKLTGLNILSAQGNKLTDIQHISNCTEITELNLSGNAITNLSAISSMSKLRVLDFSKNQVTELPKFASQDTLTSIDGSSNLLSSLEALKGQANLNYVIMEFNSGITSVLPLRNCFALIEVRLYATGVKDASVLTSMEVIVSYTPI